MSYRFFRTEIRSLFSAVSIAGIFTASMLANPAKPGVIRVRQGDNSYVEVTLRGDERHHCWFTPDGYPLIRNGDTFYYAQVREDGHLLPSSVRVSGTPTAEEMQFRSSTSASQLTARLNRSLTLDSDRNTRRLPGLFPNASFPLTGEQRALVILVEYQDVEMTMPDAHDYFSRMLNEEGFSDYEGTGSARDFFLECSGGRLDCRFDVYGPVRLSRNRVYYGGNDPYYGQDMRPEMMVIEACQQLDGTVDFSQYDRDGDGWIDNVFIFYAGAGESSGAAAETIWPHSFNITARHSEPYVFDGVRLDRYACSYEWEESRPDGVGTFIHEFGHVMGLPDLYPTNYEDSFTPGPWSTMDRGSYNNNGHTPPLFSAFERAACRWLDPIPLDRPMSIALPPIDSNLAVMVMTDNPNEYFLMENRQQNGWDKYLPGHGMLVWHIDYDAEKWTKNTANNNSGHQHIDIEEADGLPSESSRGGDVFPGSLMVDEFTDDTRPGMRAWNGKRQYVPITNIREKDGVVTFDVKGGALLKAPLLTASIDNASGCASLKWERVMVEPIEEGEAYAPSHYLLNVYRIADDGQTRIYIDGYRQRNIGDVDTFVLPVEEGESFVTVQGAYGLQTGHESKPVILGNTNGVGNVSMDMSVVAEGQNVCINGCHPGQKLNLYDPFGVLLATTVADAYGKASVHIDRQGVTIISSSTSVCKIIIR